MLKRWQEYYQFLFEDQPEEYLQEYPNTDGRELKILRSEVEATLKKSKT